LLSSATSIQFGGQGSLNLFANLTSIASTAVGGDRYNSFWVAGSNDTLLGGNVTDIFLGVTGNDSVTVGSGNNIIVP
jgi:Ca2+-binding RTX toxin-like protein